MSSALCSSSLRSSSRGCAAHAAYFSSFAEHAGPRLIDNSIEQLRWWNRLVADIANIRAAIEWFETSGDPVDALRIVGALDRFWTEYSFVDEGRKRLRHLLSLDTTCTPIEVRAKGLSIAARDGDVTTAVRLLSAGILMETETGVPFRKPIKLHFEHLAADLRERIGEASFAAAWAFGQSPRPGRPPRSAKSLRACHVASSTSSACWSTANRIKRLPTRSSSPGGRPRSTSPPSSANWKSRPEPPQPPLPPGTDFVRTLPSLQIRVPDSEIQFEGQFPHLNERSLHFACGLRSG